MSTIKKDFSLLLGGKLKNFRLSKDLSQDEFAKILGVSKGNVNDAERGFAPSAFFCAGIARAYPNDIHYLLTGSRPDAMQVDEDEREVLEALRTLPPLSRKPLLDFIKTQKIQKERD